jgi:hypothetical protein
MVPLYILKTKIYLFSTIREGRRERTGDHDGVVLQRPATTPSSTIREGRGRGHGLKAASFLAGGARAAEDLSRETWGATMIWGVR